MPSPQKQAPAFIVVRTDVDLKTEKAICTCLCKCGTEFKAPKKDVIDNKVFSCGCQDTTEEVKPKKKKTQAFAPRRVPSRTGEIHGYITVDELVRDPAGNIYWKWHCVCGFKGKQRTKMISSMTEKTTCGATRCENMMRNGLTIDEAHAIVRKYRNRS